LEVDRREISRRITQLKHELERVRAHRQQYRRRREGANLPVVAIVGYTNAGKSTLLNALAGGDIHTEDKLFATLDPTTRRVAMKGGQEVLFTDTVGFIRKLPTTLVAAFRATLEEIAEADVLLHVVDISHKNAVQQAETVGEILKELGASEQDVVTALNKVDRLENPALVESLIQEFPNAVAISAQDGIGLDHLLEVIAKALSERWTSIRVQIPYSEGDLVALFHTRGIVEQETHEPGGTLITGRTPRWMLGPLRPYIR
jgi:GTP-binding protein HflX